MNLIMKHQVYTLQWKEINQSFLTLKIVLKNRSNLYEINIQNY